MAADIWKRVHAVLLIMEEAGYKFEDKQERETWMKEEKELLEQSGQRMCR